MVKSILFLILTDVTHGRGYVYSLQYHIVWVTKYRKHIFTGGIETNIRQYLLNAFKSLDMDIIAMEVMPDHIHFLFNCKPQLRLSDAIKISKSNTARWLCLAHLEVKKQLWGRHPWNPSYLCVKKLKSKHRKRIPSFKKLFVGGTRTLCLIPG